MRVEADLFSGRPNPAWQLDAAEAERLAHLVRGLAAAAEPAREEGGLGYRGLTVKGAERLVPGCEELRVAGGRAWVRGPAGSRGYLDPDRRLERWLVETAAGRIDPGVLELLRAEAGG